MGVNQFTYLTHEEFVDTYLKYIQIPTKNIVIDETYIDTE